MPVGGLPHPAGAQRLGRSGAASEWRRPGWRALVIIAAIALAVCACGSLPVSQSTASDGAPTGPTAPRVITLPVDGESGEPLVLTIRDASGATVSARSASSSELKAHDPALLDAPATLIRLDASHALVLWMGTACDVSATLEISARWETMSLRLGPRPACDLTGDPRGVVLEARDSLPATQPRVSFDK